MLAGSIFFCKAKVESECRNVSSLCLYGAPMYYFRVAGYINAPFVVLIQRVALRRITCEYIAE
jgi:hypothetical protein